ncbi:MAG: protealysin inhibitor emfourin [Chloroflexota bacterium]
MKAKRIKFERTGGFAGIRFAADFNMSDLPADQAQQILGLLNDVGFDKLPEQIVGNSQVADGFNYSITVETKIQQHTVTTSDTVAPPNMGPLLDLLTQIAIQKARNKT